MFDTFTQQYISMSGIDIFTRKGGSGPPLLLLHGYPQSHLTWYRVAALLCKDFTVVVTDLRGYGDSSKPPGDPLHETYSKRTLAKDQVKVMEALGFERFFVAGHDRGGRVGHRMALDYPENVLKLAVLDIVPTLTMYEQMTTELALPYYHWLFLSQPEDLPERLIGSDPELYLRHRGTGIGSLTELKETFDEYLRHFRDPAMIHATCEDYRAAVSIDVEHHRKDREYGYKVECPLLVLWGTEAIIAQHFDVPQTWREVAQNVQGYPVHCGHYIQEEKPERSAELLYQFFK